MYIYLCWGLVSHL